MRSDLAGTAALQNRVSKNPARQRQQAMGGLAGMSTKDIIAKHQEMSDKSRGLFKRQAEIAVSFITLYLSNIERHQRTSMLLFERKFIFELLQQLRDLIIQEGSYSLDFNEQLLNAFLFEKLETADPLKLDTHDQPLLALRSHHLHNVDRLHLFFSSQELFQKFLNILLQSISEQIRCAKLASVAHPDQAASLVIQTKNTLKTIIERLYEQVVEPASTSIAMLKFARSLTRENINYLKKVYIFLRESVQDGVNDRLELGKTIQKLNEIFIQTFSRVPSAVVLRDFFSFLREIFFYSDRMDLVDHALAQDMLTVMLDTIRRNSKHDLEQHYHSQQTSLMHLQDSFFFSKVTKGVLLLNDVKLAFKEDLFFCIMFNVNLEAIQEEM